MTSEKLIEIAENQKKVYDTGYDTGYEKGVNDGQLIGYEEGKIKGQEIGYEEGKKAEYDAFWDAYQANGARVNYLYAFGNTYWNDTTFKPKYDIKPTNSVAYMFYDFRGTNLTQTLNKCKVILDTSKSVEVIRMFYGARTITSVPTISLESATSATDLFRDCVNLHTIEKLILKQDGTNTFSNAFQNCRSLEHIEDIEGVIGQNGLNLQWSTKLHCLTLERIVKALSTTTSGLTLTLSKAAVDREFEENSGDNNGSMQQDWTDIVALRPNWTISLV